MSLLVNTLAAVAACTVLATGALAHSAVVPLDNEPAPRLIVEPPLPGPLARGVVFIPYRVENLRILPLGGPAARNVSPRVGHLHITVDDLPWQWADYGQQQHHHPGGHAARPAQGADRGGGRRRQRLHRTNGDVHFAGQGGSSMKLQLSRGAIRPRGRHERSGAWICNRRSRR